MTQHSTNRKMLTSLFFRLLPFQIVLIVINAVNGIVDSLYASNVIGKTAMSAIGLYAPLTHFLYAASMMFVSGSQILYGRHLPRDRERINTVFTVDLTIAAILSVITAGVLALAVSTGATRIFVSSQPDLDMFNHYILGNAIGIPALVIGQQLFAFLSLENQTRRTMAASIMCFVLNAILDHIFVVMMNMGAFGLGLSSSIASWAFLAIQLQFYIAGKSEWKFSLKNLIWGDAKDIALLGYPGALSRFLEMFRCFIVNFLILKFVGSVGLSSFAASNALLAVFWAVPFGMSAVARMLFSISIGEEDRRSTLDTMWVSLARGLIVMCAVSAFIIILAEPFTRLYYRDAADPVYHMTVMGFRMLPLCMPLSLISLLFSCYAQTIEKRALSIIIPVIDGAVGVIVLSFILIPTMKMNGLYLANILNGVACLIVIFLYARHELRRTPKSLEDLMAMPASFGLPESERLDISVHSMEDVMDISNRVIAFCQERGIDRRRSYYAGLCLEEMAGNVVRHGFPQGTRDHLIEIRVQHNKDQILMRIRDNCIAFNPSEHSLKMMMDEEGKNIGIHLIYSIASDVQYQHLLGLNVLTIRL